MSNYILADAAAEKERLRLSRVESFLDPITQDWLRTAGIAPGWRCLEIGCGSGTMLRWMAEQVRPQGRVVGIDIDPRFVEEVNDSVTEVRTADILTADVETEHFDLAYARLLLIHLNQPLVALRRMAEAVKPGGIVLVLDLDITSMRAADQEHLKADAFDRHLRDVLEAWSEGGRMDPAIGSKLVDLFAAADLRIEKSDKMQTVFSGRSEDALFAAADLRIEKSDKMQTVFSGRSEDAKTYSETILNSASNTNLAKDTIESLLDIFDDPSFTYHSDQINIVLGRKRE
jgi:SAM-dependent methyltransferase